VAEMREEIARRRRRDGGPEKKKEGWWLISNGLWVEEERWQWRKVDQGRRR
jgi:hypothetical protein